MMKRVGRLRIRTIVVDADIDAATRLQEILRADSDTDVVALYGGGNEALPLLRAYELVAAPLGKNALVL